MNATLKAAAQLKLNNELAQFMPAGQRMALTLMLNGEEGEHAAELVMGWSRRISAIPKTYETDGQGKEAVAHLHYFRGGVDAYITERDMGNGPDDQTQQQAMGLVSLYGGGAKDGELGYVSIEDLIENNVELDLYFQPKTLRELQS